MLLTEVLARAIKQLDLLGLEHPGGLVCNLKSVSRGKIFLSEENKTPRF
jgi:hypothetical protein